MSIDVAVETPRLSIFVVVVFGLPNIYRYFSFSIGNSRSCSIILFAFYRLISFLTKMIVISGTAMNGYPNVVLIILLLIFFFNKKIACMSLVLAFIANILNSIMKSTICFFSYLNVLIFHSVSAILLYYWTLFWLL